MEFIFSNKRRARIASVAAVVIVFAAVIVTGIACNWPMYIMSVIPALMAVATGFALCFSMKVKNWLGVFAFQFIMAFAGFFLLHFPTLNGVHMTLKAAVLNGMIITSLLFLLQAVTGRIKAVGIVWLIISLGYGILNHAVYMFRGSIININDFGSIRTAATVAGDYSLEMHPSLVISLYMFACALIFALRSKIDIKCTAGKTKRIFALLLAIIIAVMPVYFLKSIKPKLWRNRAAQYNGILMEYLAELSWLNIEAPEGYSTEAVDALLSDYASVPIVSSEEKPHIIAVMVEAYSDLSVLGDVNLSEDVMANYNAICEESIHGYACASIFGGNTANSEWEFLTGNSLAFLPGSTIPYRQYMDEKHNSLLDILMENGYSCYAMHPFRNTGWDRHIVYPRIGFKESYFINDLDWGETVRSFISDDAYVNQVIAQYEARKSEGPLFLFGVTMQNHGGYDKPGFTADVCVENMKKEYPNADQYVSLIKLTDEALAKLVDYFRNVDEKVQIVVFGDHQPNLKSSFYSELGVKEEQTKRMVPFCIWNNYAPVSKEVPTTSLNYLSAMLLEAAGLEMPPYHRYLLDLQKKLPVVNSLGYVAADGTTGNLDELTGEYGELMQEYHILQYANMFDTTIDDSYFIGAAAQ